MKELLLGWRVRVLAALCLGLAALSNAAWSAEAPAVSEFAWRGTLTLPAQASLVRVEVPVAALLRMQSSAGHDLRVFNAAGDTVPFALLGRAELSHVAPTARTASYPAYTLFSAASAGKPTRGAVEVQVNTNGQRSSAWVRLDTSGVTASATPPGAQPLQAALFDLRAEQQAVDALELSIDLPRNVLVSISVATSTDLKDWTVVASKGPLFQFDGEGAPSSHTLELHQSLPLKKRYLRLAWPGQNGVVLRSLVGRVAPAHTVPAPLRAALPPGMPDSKGGLTWTLPFATPLPPYTCKPCTTTPWCRCASRAARMRRNPGARWRRRWSTGSTPWGKVPAIRRHRCTALRFAHCGSRPARALPCRPVACRPRSNLRHCNWLF